MKINLRKTTELPLILKGLEENAAVFIKVSGRISYKTLIASSEYMKSGNKRIHLDISHTFGIDNIPEKCFENCIDLKMMDLPLKIREIGERAFCASGLNEIIIPERVVRFYSGCFFECSFLEKVQITGDVFFYEFDYTRKEGPFESCKSLKEAILPAKLYKIGARMFASCTSLEKINIPEKLSVFEFGAFMNCEELQNIKVGKDVIIIDDYAFSGCSGDITVDKENRKYSSYEGMLFDKGQERLLSVPAGRTSVTIPESVKIIEAGAFSDCRKIKEITIPNTVNEIECGAFYGCSQLENIHLPENI
ncbi:MAG TPA: leucine-rich repeat domain-containing protein, partial [bacterium]|nr:leucine-rich repeat domain-containing protein [bacterium]